MTGRPLQNPSDDGQLDGQLRRGQPGSGGAAKLTFEQALAEIELIIERIETGEVGLEDALADYERGVGLIAQCRGRLDQAQRKVEDLTRRLESADEEGASAGAEEDADAGSDDER